MKSTGFSTFRLRLHSKTGAERMSEQAANLALIKSLYSPALDWRHGRMAELFSDDVEAVYNGSPDQIPFAGVAHGPEAAIALLARIRDYAVVHKLDPQKFVTGGDDVVVFGHAEGEGKATGRPFSVNWVQAWTVKNGRIISVHYYNDTAALQAALS